MSPSKYARLEHERRFLVSPDSGWQAHIKPYSKLFQDRYLACGRLRIRRIEDSDTGNVTFKLTKKFESQSSFSQPIVSIQLSGAEYETLAALPGYDLSKTRHYQEHDGRIFSIDVFHGDLTGLIICETEAETIEALQAVRFPPYARWEITQDSLFTGGSLCRARWPEIEEAIAKIEARSRDAHPG